MSKRAASAKVKRQDEQAPFDPESYFNEAKDGMLTIIDAQIRNCDRIDCLVGARNDLKDFGLSAMVHDSQSVCDLMKDTFGKLRVVVEDLKYKDFTKEDMKDPVLSLVPTRTKIKGDREMFDAMTIFNCVRPIGEKLEILHIKIYEAVSSDKASK